MIGLQDITRVRVPVAQALEAHAHLNHVGKYAAEGFALWAGIHDGTTFLVRETVIPVHRSMRSSAGIAVMVDGDELHHINCWLYERGMVLVAQLHSHPDAAFHSPTDDAFPIATMVGSLSLVVPHFAQAPFMLNQCAVFRLAPDGTWCELPTDEARELIIIEE